MQPLLKIASAYLDPDNTTIGSFDLTGRCAFAICTEGEFTIRILNERYVVKSRDMFACMPFVNVEILDVIKPSEIIFGFVQIKNVPMMINRWVNTNNLTAIQNHPLIEIPEEHFSGLIRSIKEYVQELEDFRQDNSENICKHIQNDINDFRSKLIVAQVLKIYFSEIQMRVAAHTHYDYVFQHFMLLLYNNFRLHRDVRYYASRSGLSLKYFSTIIRQVSGSSPSYWIETVVVSEAKSLLNEIRNSIKIIAASLNFPDAPTFTKYFRRVTGMTPKAYRKTIQ